jgi:hypothetical protein
MGISTSDAADYFGDAREQTPMIDAEWGSNAAMGDIEEAPPSERPRVVPPTPRASLRAERGRSDRVARWRQPALAVTLVVATGVVWGPEMESTRQVREQPRVVSGSPTTRTVASSPAAVAEVRAVVAQALAPAAVETHPAPAIRPSRPARVWAPPPLSVATPPMPALPYEATVRRERAQTRDDVIDDLIRFGLEREELVSTGPPPATPSRTQVTHAMAEVSGEVAGCGRGEHGVATVQVTVTGETGAARGSLGGPFAGTEVGACIEAVIATARFPRFTNPTFSFTFPFRL